MQKYGPAIAIGIVLVGVLIYFINRNSHDCGCGGKKEGGEEMGPL